MKCDEERSTLRSMDLSSCPAEARRREQIWVLKVQELKNSSMRLALTLLSYSPCVSFRAAATSIGQMRPRLELIGRSGPRAAGMATAAPSRPKVAPASASASTPAQALGPLQLTRDLTRLAVSKAGMAPKASGRRRVGLVSLSNCRQ